jgi:transcriptional regulator with XRE-family HTH domain
MRRNSPVSYPEILGRTIKARRKELNMDQVKLAELTGIPQSTISRIERGEALLNSEQVSSFADALLFSPSDFWIRADEIKRELQARGATILRERLSQDLIRSYPTLITGAALVGWVATLSGQDPWGSDD